MSHIRRTRPTRTGTGTARASAVLAGLALLAATAACGKDDDAKQPAADPTPSVSSSASATPTPTPTPTPSASPSASPTRSATIYDRLLSADRLPGFNESWDWSVRDTTTDPVKLGTCARFPLQTLGAEQTVTRSYQPTGDEGGGFGRQAVATFVDDRSADQAMAVLRTFHDTCKQRLTGFSKVDVRPVTSVPVARGEASWYLTLTVAKGADDGHFNALGVLRDGLTIELVELDLLGQDYNYAGGREPMVAALQNAARQLS